MAIPSRDVESAAAIRLAWLTLAVGLAAAIVVALCGRPRMGAGVAIGTLLAWLNYRWLKLGVDALVVSATEGDGPVKPARSRGYLSEIRRSLFVDRSGAYMLAFQCSRYRFWASFMAYWP